MVDFSQVLKNLMNLIKSLNNYEKSNQDQDQLLIGSLVLVE